MKVLFVKDSLPTAMAGDVLDVKNGFARNWLLPHAIAIPATKNNLERAESLREEAAKRRAKMNANLAELAKTIKAEEFVLVARSTPQGRLYGSITPGMIMGTIENQLDIKLPKRAIRTAAIRFAGNHNVELVLSPTVKENIGVTVKADRDPDTDDKDAPQPQDAAEQPAADEEPEASSGD